MPRIRKRLPDPEAKREWIIQLLRTQSTTIPVPLPECQMITGDPEDDYVLATARLGEADYLVTGDQGLLDLKRYAGAKIVNPREFIAIIGFEPETGQSTLST